MESFLMYCYAGFHIGLCWIVFCQPNKQTSKSTQQFTTSSHGTHSHAFTFHGEYQMLARSVTHLWNSLTGLCSCASMDVTVLEHFRHEHAANPFMDSSVGFAHRVLQHFRRELRRSDGSLLCVRTSFTIPPRIPLQGPVQLQNFGDEDLGDVQVWDWRRFIAALPRENYNSFTGGAGILQIGLRPIIGTVDPDGGPVWDFYLVLDRSPAVTVYIHPDANDTEIKRWSTRTDKQRAAELAALSIVNPECGPDSVAIL
jgi:hypothetical protein